MAEFNSDKMLSYLQEKWGDRQCPMCGKGPLTVQDKVFQLTEFHHGSLVMGGPLVPIVPVVCNNCGNTILVNAIIAGAIQLPSPAAETVPPSQPQEGQAAK